MEYKGYYIEADLLGNNFFTVQYDGDDVVFPTIESAKKFIDDLVDLSDYAKRIYG